MPAQLPENVKEVSCDGDLVYGGKPCSLECEDGYEPATQDEGSLLLTCGKDGVTEPISGACTGTF